jgi:hypothetical protein
VSNRWSSRLQDWQRPHSELLVFAKVNFKALFCECQNQFQQAELPRLKTHKTHLEK